jgi:hypothetical protein
MPILGLGELGAGEGPMGLWLEEADEATEEEQGERYLDPVTKDYAVGPGGVVLRGSAARQRMIIAVTTRAGTSLSVRGIRFPDAHGPNTARLTEAEIRAATQPMVDDGTVQIDAINVATEANLVPGRLGIEIAFTNLETGEPEDPIEL